jgi:hypothetical protein
MNQESFVTYIDKIQDFLSTKTELVKGILDNLHVHFPRDENGFSEVEFYIFSQNFGKPSYDSNYESPEDLYLRLMDTKKTNHVL